VFEKLNAGIFLVLVNKLWLQSMIRKVSRGPGQEFLFKLLATPETCASS
jgi:hypothetical protein